MKKVIAMIWRGIELYGFYVGEPFMLLVATIMPWIGYCHLLLGTTGDEFSRPESFTYQTFLIYVLALLVHIATCLAAYCSGKAMLTLFDTWQPKAFLLALATFGVYLVCAAALATPFAIYLTHINQGMSTLPLCAISLAVCLPYTLWWPHQSYARSTSRTLQEWYD